MLKTLKDMIGYRIRAQDGDFGKVRDFFFDDHSWTIRYVVVDTGRWLPGQQVLLAPAEVKDTDVAARMLAVSLTRQQIENAPNVETDLPVSRQKESELAAYYGWEPYWGTLGGPAVGTLVRVQSPATVAEHPGDPHLRSVQESIGYHIQAADGEIGHVDDYIAQHDDLGIRYMVVATRNWMPGRKVLVSPAWVQRFDWANALVHLDLSRQEIQNAPHFDPNAPVDRSYEQLLHEHYQRPPYWED